MMNGIVIIGAGGHAKVCIEILRSAGEEIAFCISNGPGSGKCMGIPILCGDENLTTLRSAGYGRAFIAIGANNLRVHLSEKAVGLGYALVNAISPFAIVSKSAAFGTGVAVMAGVVINAETQVANLAIINTGATVDHDCRIGFAAHVGPQCALAGNVSIGDKTFLGVGCKVIPGITIGECTVIGAGAVVTTDIGSSVTAVGLPARVTKTSPLF